MDFLRNEVDLVLVVLLSRVLLLHGFLLIGDTKGCFYGVSFLDGSETSDGLSVEVN